MDSTSKSKPFPTDATERKERWNALGVDPCHVDLLVEFMSGRELPEEDTRRPEGTKMLYTRLAELLQLIKSKTCLQILDEMEALHVSIMMKRLRLDSIKGPWLDTIENVIQTNFDNDYRKLYSLEAYEKSLAERCDKFKENADNWMNLLQTNLEQRNQIIIQLVKLAKPA